MMDKERLEQIERRASEATPGPWEADTGVRGDCVVFGPNGRFLMNAQSEPHWMPYPGETRYVSFDVDKRDAEFIADARKDVPDLVAEVRRLQAVVDKVQEITDTFFKKDMQSVNREETGILGENSFEELYYVLKEARQ